MSCTGTRTATQAMTVFEFSLSADGRCNHRDDAVNGVAPGLLLLAEH
ncbi:hypothetical protein ACQKEK_18070 [Pseudomonas sp. NPDC077408]